MYYLPNPAQTIYQLVQSTNMSKFKSEVSKRYEEFKSNPDHHNACEFGEGEKWMTSPNKKCLLCGYDFQAAETTIENEDQTENTGFYWAKYKKYCSEDGEYRIFSCSSCNFVICHSCRQNAIDLAFDIASIGEPLHLPNETETIGKKLDGNTESEDWAKEARKRIQNFKAKDNQHQCNFEILIDWASEASHTTCNICGFSHFNLYDEDLDDQEYYWTDSGYWDDRDKYSKFYSGTLYVCSGCKIRTCFACREEFDKI
jgi:hypothetical protein